MKRNQKGFTLIELLAVIVILAVIALIATPLIMNVINDAKHGANRDAAYGVVKAVETSAMQKMALDPTFAVPAECTLNGDKCEWGDSEPKESLAVDFKGTKPTSATIKFDTSKGSVADGTVVTFGTDTFTMSGGIFPAE